MLDGAVLKLWMIGRINRPYFESISSIIPENDVAPIGCLSIMKVEQPSTMGLNIEVILIILDIIISMSLILIKRHKLPDLIHRILLPPKHNLPPILAIAINLHNFIEGPVVDFEPGR